MKTREKWKALASSSKPVRGRTVTDAPFDGRGDSVWKNAGGALPQFFAWDMGEDSELTALAVQSAIPSDTGRIKDYALYASADGKAWTKVKSGSLESSPNAVKIAFESPFKTRYLKLEATSLHAGEDMVLSEIEAFAR